MSPGEQIGPYEIVRRIGTGGMAEVFEAYRPGIEGFRTRVAVKCMHHADDERFVQLFINEARLGSQLRHVNIVNIQDFNRAGDYYYLVMELVDGVDLRSVLNQLKSAGRPFDPGLAVQILIQVLAGLAYAHSAVDDQGRTMGLIHRDIKPANIILAREGVAKILDFGVAKTLVNVYRTQEAVPRGTLAYMSPEQVGGDLELTAASDLFSVGAILFEMLMGRGLYEEDSYPRFLMAVGEADVREQLKAFKARFPALHGVLKHALAREVDKRYQTATAMATDLFAVLQKLPPGPSIPQLLAGLDVEGAGTQHRSHPSISGATLSRSQGSRSSLLAFRGRSLLRRPAFYGLLLGGLGVGLVLWWGARAPEPGGDLPLAGSLALQEGLPGGTSGQVGGQDPESQGAGNPLSDPPEAVVSSLPTLTGSSGSGHPPDAAPPQAPGGSTSSPSGSGTGAKPTASGSTATGRGSPVAGSGSGAKNPRSDPQNAPTGTGSGNGLEAGKAGASSTLATPSRPTPVPDDQAAARPAPAGEGVLILASVPPDADVYEGGSRRCEVPCELKLPAGSHTYELRSHDGRFRKKVDVQVQADRVRKLVWDFDREEWLAK